MPQAEPLAYEVGVLICDLGKPSPGEGYLQIALGGTTFTPYYEPVPLKVRLGDGRVVCLGDRRVVSGGRTCRLS